MDDWRDDAWEGHAASQAECDAIQEEARIATGAVPLLRDAKQLAPLEATPDPVEARIAEELVYAQTLLEGIADHLILDPVILERHQIILQGFDIISQLLGHLGKVVGSQDKVEAIDRIGMHELRSRLKRLDEQASPWNNCRFLTL